MTLSGSQTTEHCTVPCQQSHQDKHILKGVEGVHERTESLVYYKGENKQWEDSSDKEVSDKLGRCSEEGNLGLPARHGLHPDIQLFPPLL